MDGLVMGDAVAEQVKFAHGLMHIPAHAAPVDPGKGIAKAWQPERTLVAARKQEAPEAEREFGHHSTNV
jgi:hypothetical protein